MGHFLAKHFHHATNPDDKPFPSEYLLVKTPRHYKEYKRMPIVNLTKEFLSLGLLSDSLINRQSTKSFKNTSCTEQELSSVLYYTAAEKNNGKRPYPSSGGRFVLELYVALQGVLGINDGIYHYNVRSHTLTQILKAKDIDEFKKNLKYTWTREAPVTFIITAVLDRLSGKYEDFSYRLALLEAGHLSQSILLTSQSLGIKQCVIGALNHVTLDDCLDITTEDEISLIGIVLGKTKSDV